MDFAGARLVRTLLVRRRAPSFLFRLHAIFSDGRPTVAAPLPQPFPFAFAPWAPWLCGYRFFLFAALLRALCLLIVAFDRICRLCVIALVLDSLLLSYSIVVLIPHSHPSAHTYTHSVSPALFPRSCPSTPSRIPTTTVIRICTRPCALVLASAAVILLYRLSIIPARSRSYAPSLGPARGRRRSTVDIPIFAATPPERTAAP